MDHILDAKNKKLGRLASEVALILQGKKKADYAPNKDNSDKVVIKRAVWNMLPKNHLRSRRIKRLTFEK